MFRKIPAFLNKVANCRPATSSKRDFSIDISKNIFFAEHFPATASVKNFNNREINVSTRSRFYLSKF